MKKSSLIVASIIGLLMIPFYVYTYKNGSNMFWAVFLVDRIGTTLVLFKYGEYLHSEDIKLEKKEGSIFISDKMMRMIMLSIIGIIMVSYILIKYPQIFIVLVLGKIIDKIIAKFSKAINKIFQ